MIRTVLLLLLLCMASSLAAGPLLRTGKTAALDDYFFPYFSAAFNEFSPSFQALFPGIDKGTARSVVSAGYRDVDYTSLYCAAQLLRPNSLRGAYLAKPRFEFREDTIAGTLKTESNVYRWLGMMGGLWFVPTGTVIRGAALNWAGSNTKNLATRADSSKQSQSLSKGSLSNIGLVILLKTVGPGFLRVAVEEGENSNTEDRITIEDGRVTYSTYYNRESFEYSVQAGYAYLSSKGTFLFCNIGAAPDHRRSSMDPWKDSEVSMWIEANYTRKVNMPLLELGYGVAGVASEDFLHEGDSTIYDSFIEKYGFANSTWDHEVFFPLVARAPINGKLKVFISWTPRIQYTGYRYTDETFGERAEAKIYVNEGTMGLFYMPSDKLSFRLLPRFGYSFTAYRFEAQYAF